MKILIKYPSRNRKNKFLSTLRKYQNFLSKEIQVHFLVSLDDDDEEMKDNVVKEVLESYDNLTCIFGKSESKVHAINRDINNFTDWDIVLLASDDMIPQIKGYDKIIVEKMKNHFPDTDGVLFFNDGFKKNELNTLCILGKKYYERFNYIYYPDYKSVWCDNEFTEVANILKKQKYFDEVIIRHEHPDWGYGKQDLIYNKNYQNLNHDMSLYNSRKRNIFDLNIKK